MGEWVKLNPYIICHIDGHLYLNCILDYLVFWFISGSSEGRRASLTTEIGNVSMQGNLVTMSVYARSPPRTDSGGKIGEAQRRKSINVLDLMCQTEVLLVLICHYGPICKFSLASNIWCSISLALLPHKRVNVYANEGLVAQHLLAWVRMHECPAQHLPRSLCRLINFSIYTLIDLGDSSDLIGSPARTMTFYSPPSAVNIKKNKIAVVNWVFCQSFIVKPFWKYTNIQVLMSTLNSSWYSILLWR